MHDCFGESVDEKHDLSENGTRSSALRLKICWNFFSLTLGFGGLQCVFALQFVCGSQYLMNLGVSDYVTTLIWLAGPVAGTVLQPYICLCSDETRSPWGKRRPYIVGGALVIELSLLTLAWARELATSAVDRIFVVGGPQYAPAVTNTTIAIAVASIYALNMAIQPVQGCLRALVVDTCDKNQQEIAMAWVGGISSVFNISIYLLGYVDLTASFPFLGSSQIQTLSALTAVLFAISTAVTCVSVRERSYIGTHSAGKQRLNGAGQKLLFLLMRFRYLPPRVLRVCKVQFFTWMAWFPFLFYAAVYIGSKFDDQVARSSLSTTTTSVTSHSNRNKPIPATLSDAAARKGSLGMLLFAAASLLGGVIIPPITSLPPADNATTAKAIQTLTPMRFMAASSSQSSLPTKTTMLAAIPTWPPKPHHLWTLSHILYASCMLSTFIVPNLAGTYTIVALVGFSWAINIWAPFAIIGRTIAQDPHNNDSNDDHDEAGPCFTTSHDHEHDDEIYERRPGTVTGLHNVAIAAPQILSALLCAVIFKICDSLAIANSIQYVLGLGGATSLVAAIFAGRLEVGIEEGGLSSSDGTLYASLRVDTEA